MFVLSYNGLKTYLVLSIGFLAIISCNKYDPQETVKAFISAHNEHKVEKALTYYHPDVVFELKNTWTKSGIDEMKTLEVWDSALNSHLKLESLQTRGDSVYCSVVENNDWFSSVDINDLIHDPVVFIVEDQKIKKIIAVPSEETGQQIQQVIGSVMQWSQETGDSTIYQLLPNNDFVYSAEAAVLWLELFERWNGKN